MLLRCKMEDDSGDDAEQAPSGPVVRTLLSLPDELLVPIFASLPLTTQSKLASVSTRLANIFNDEPAWRVRLATTYPMSAYVRAAMGATVARLRGLSYQPSSKQVYELLARAELALVHFPRRATRLGAPLPPAWTPGTSIPLQQGPLGPDPFSPPTVLFVPGRDVAIVGWVRHDDGMIAYVPGQHGAIRQVDLAQSTGSTFVSMPIFGPGSPWLAFSVRPLAAGPRGDVWAAAVYDVRAEVPPFLLFTRVDAPHASQRLDLPRSSAAADLYAKYDAPESPPENLRLRVTKILFMPVDESTGAPDFAVVYTESMFAEGMLGVLPELYVLVRETVTSEWQLLRAPVAPLFRRGVADTNDGTVAELLQSGRQYGLIGAFTPTVFVCMFKTVYHVWKISATTRAVAAIAAGKSRMFSMPESACVVARHYEICGTGHGSETSRRTTYIERFQPSPPGGAPTQGNDNLTLTQLWAMGTESDAPSTAEARLFRDAFAPRSRARHVVFPGRIISESLHWRSLFVGSGGGGPGVVPQTRTARDDSSRPSSWRKVMGAAHGDTARPFLAISYDMRYVATERGLWRVGGDDEAAQLVSAEL